MRTIVFDPLSNFAISAKLPFMPSTANDWFPPSPQSAMSGPDLPVEERKRAAAQHEVSRHSPQFANFPVF
jgi:hypothetical protein